MDCATVYFDADEMSQVISLTRPKARKLHRCSECKRTIVEREEYERFVGKMDDIFTVKTCLDCLSVREEFFKSGYYYERVWENLVDHIYDCRGEISETSISKLTPSAQRRVCSIIMDCWEREEDDE